MSSQLPCHPEQEYHGKQRGCGYLAEHEQLRSETFDAFAGPLWWLDVRCRFSCPKSKGGYLKRIQWRSKGICCVPSEKRFGTLSFDAAQ